MENKLELLQKLLPKAALKPMTPEALDALPPLLKSQGLVLIEQFPFRVGRESRVKWVDGNLLQFERPKQPGSTPNNDLYLLDKGNLLNISREHFAIDTEGERFVLVDRGSACGTKLGNVPLGAGTSQKRVELQDGDVIGVGAKGTPYLYQFISFLDCRVMFAGDNLKD